MRSVGFVNVLICGGGPATHLTTSPSLLCCVHPPQPGLGHLPMSSEGNKAQSSLSCYVSLPTNVSATVGQWLILVHLAKCLQDVCLGCLFPPPLPTPAPPRVLKSWVESGMPTSPPPPPPLPPAVTQSQPPPVWGGGGSSSSWRHKALPDLTMIFFSNHSFFVTPLAVCWVCAGVWWEKAWPSMEKLQHFTVSVAD